MTICRRPHRAVGASGAGSDDREDAADGQLGLLVRGRRRHHDLEAGALVADLDDRGPELALAVRLDLLVGLIAALAGLAHDLDLAPREGGHLAEGDEVVTLADLLAGGLEVVLRLAGRV